MSHEAVDGGDEPCKSPIKGYHSILGANSLGQTRKIRTNDLGQIEIVNMGGAGPTVSILGASSITSLIAGTPATLVSFTATAVTYITEIRGEGTDRSKFHLRLNATTLFDYRRSTRGKNVEWAWQRPGFTLQIGDILEVRVEHNTPGGIQADYTGVIYGGT